MVLQILVFIVGVFSGRACSTRKFEAAAEGFITTFFDPHRSS